MTARFDAQLGDGSLVRIEVVDGAPARIAEIEALRVVVSSGDLHRIDGATLAAVRSPGQVLFPLRAPATEAQLHVVVERGDAPLLVPV